MRVFKIFLIFLYLNAKKIRHGYNFRMNPIKSSMRSCSGSVLGNNIFIGAGFDLVGKSALGIIYFLARE